MPKIKRLLLSLILLIWIGSAMAKADYRDIPMIDTHIHLYDPTRPEGVPWPKPNDKPLYKPTLPKHFKPIAKQNGLAATVIVEASDRFEDNQWLLDLTQNEKITTRESLATYP